VAGVRSVREDHTYLPGELAVVDAPSQDPLTLRRQLTNEQPPMVGVAGWLRALAEMNTFHLLNRAQRAAVLQVLADADGLAYDGMLPDRSARVGIAISALSTATTSDADRDTLIFSTDTGVLLSHEQTTISGSGPHGAQATTTSYMLYLPPSRTDHLA
jgi:hypothetical protein